MTARFAPHSVSAAVDAGTKPFLSFEANGKPTVSVPFPGGSFLFATSPADLDAIARVAREGARMLRDAQASAEAGTELASGVIA